MRKKAIERIPFRGGVPAKQTYHSTVTVFTAEIAEPHLFVEVYENQEDKLQTPWLRAVFTQKDWGLFYPESGAWSAAGLEDVKRQITKNSQEQVYITKQDDEVIWEFCGDKYDSRRYDSWIRALENLIEDIRRSRRQQRAQNRKQRLKERIQNTPPLPADLKQWAEEDLFYKGHFLYYKRRGRYADIACSACGRVTTVAIREKNTFDGAFEHVIYPPEHDEMGMCPRCKTVGTYKAQGRMRGVWGIKKRCFVAQPYKTKGAVIRYVEIEKIYTLEKALEQSVEIMMGAKETMVLTEIARIYLEKDKKPQTDFHKYSSITGTFWDDCNLYGAGNICIAKAQIYEKSYDLLKGTFLQYSGAQAYGQYTRIYNLKDYMTRYLQWPQMEMLSKMGLYGIVESIMQHDNWIIKRIIKNRHANTPEDFLGICKTRIKDLIKTKGNTEYLKIYQLEKEFSMHLTEQEAVFMKESGICQADFRNLLQYTTVTKLMHKITGYAQVEIPEHAEEAICPRAAAVLRGISNTYKDYFNMRLAGRYDLHNQIFLFPRNLRAAHDRMVAETDQKEAEKRKQEVETKFPEIRRKYRKLRKRYWYEKDGFQIRPARSAGEIVDEGRRLHHCVGGDAYLRKHNSGESVILFLRAKDTPEIPYITIEIAGNRIVQWYGIRDTKPDEKMIENYLRDFRKKLKERQGPAAELVDAR